MTNIMEEFKDAADCKYKLLIEADKIQDGDIKSFTKKAFVGAAPEFWIAPSSSSGRFHPQEDQGIGGLVRHLIKASAVTEQFAMRENFIPYDLDIARAATLLHDIKKNGSLVWGAETQYNHGIIGAEYLQEIELKDKYAKQIILDAVRYHMAPWNTTFSNEKFFSLRKTKDLINEAKRRENIFSAEEVQRELQEKLRGSRYHHIIEKCVQEADYWASRESMSFFPGESIIPDKRVHDSPK
jgi:putative nucleotidyltransferase with HDIG domain